VREVGGEGQDGRQNKDDGGAAKSGKGAGKDKRVVFRPGLKVQFERPEHSCGGGFPAADLGWQKGRAPF